MGLFASRPEEPTEWGGIPSEPAGVESEAERLAAAAPAVDSLWGGAVESIIIPVVPVIEVPFTAVTDADPDQEDVD